MLGDKKPSISNKTSKVGKRKASGAINPSNNSNFVELHPTSIKASGAQARTTQPQSTRKVQHKALVGIGGRH